MKTRREAGLFRKTPHCATCYMGGSGTCTGSFTLSTNASIRSRLCTFVMEHVTLSNLTKKRDPPGGAGPQSPNAVRGLFRRPRRRLLREQRHHLACEAAEAAPAA